MSRTLGAVKRPADLDWSTMPDPSSPVWGEQLREWRLKVGISILQLHKAASVGRDVVDVAERGGPVSERTRSMFRALRAGGEEAAQAAKIQMALRK